MDGSFWNISGYVGHGTNYQWFDLGVIQKECWILDHFEIFVTIALKEA